MTDWKALCEELAEYLALLDEPPHEVVCRAQEALAQPEPEADGPAVPEGREPASVVGEPSDEELLDIAAQSIEPYDKIRPGEYEPENNCAIEVYSSELIAFARAVLARWGRPAPAPAEGEVAELVAALREIVEVYQSFHASGHIWNVSSGPSLTTDTLSRAADLLEQRQPTPVPVAERLPGPEDCDGEGNIWAWRRFDPEGDMDNGDFWCLAFCEWLEDEDCGYTHWLSYPSLPLPDQK